jgi:hypothetical protein
MVWKFGLAKPTVGEYLDISEETVRRAVAHWDATGEIEAPASTLHRGCRRTLNNTELGVSVSVVILS